eukprot:3655624-Alexandrium_andersonii.AAC.1
MAGRCAGLPWCGAGAARALAGAQPAHGFRLHAVQQLHPRTSAQHTPQVQHLGRTSTPIGVSVGITAHLWTCAWRASA